MGLCSRDGSYKVRKPNLVSGVLLLSLWQVLEPRKHGVMRTKKEKKETPEIQVRMAQTTPQNLGITKLYHYQKDSMTAVKNTVTFKAIKISCYSETRWSEMCCPWPATFQINGLSQCSQMPFNQVSLHSLAVAAALVWSSTFALTMYKQTLFSKKCCKCSASFSFRKQESVLQSAIGC